MKVSEHLRSFGIGSKLWPAVVVAILLVLFVLGSVQLVSQKLKISREQELLMHAHKVANALKAQIFERYADSQAFALQPTFHDALKTRSPASIKRSGEVLKELLNLYQVYRASVLTDRDGKTVTAAFDSGSRVADKLQLSGFVAESVSRWTQDPGSSLTSVSELVYSSGAPSPLQRFSSPVRDASGAVLGVITNYTSGLYLEREMSVAFEDFSRLNLPEMAIYLLDQRGTVFAVYRKGQARYAPDDVNVPGFTGESGLLKDRGNLFAWADLRDSRINKAVAWSVALATDRRAFLSEVERLKWFSYAVSAVILSILIYASIFVHQMRLEHQRALSKRMHEAQEEERARISREIHDDLGQNLTAIKIHLRRTENTDPEALLAKIEDAKVMIEETNLVIRRISRDLHPSLVENLGLGESLRWKLSQIQELLAIDCEMSIEEGLDIELLPQATKRHVFRIVQEALNNIQKHAQASEVRVRCVKKGRDLCISIQDNGIGFDAAKVAKAQNQSLGLKTMDERARLIGGRVRVTSKPGEGTTVLCRLPLPKEGSTHGA